MRLRTSSDLDDFSQIRARLRQMHHAAMQHQQGGVAVYVYIALARSRGRPGWLLASICMIKLIAKQQAANWMPKFSVKHSSSAVNRLNALV